VKARQARGLLRFVI
jgi:hypothetical protein